MTDAAVEAAILLNDSDAVSRLSKQVLANAKCDDDKMSCLYAVVKSLRLKFKFADSKKVAFTVLEQQGERLPRPFDDPELQANLSSLNDLLQSMPDDSIMNMKETNQKKSDILLLSIYFDLSFLFQFVDPSLIADTSLRMAEITLANGLSQMSPVALAQTAIVLVKIGEYSTAYRIGKIALRLLDRVNAKRYQSTVMMLVGGLVAWVA